jgi:uncharacterized membrane protein YdfJ with MMPL/SSD domain
VVAAITPARDAGLEIDVDGLLVDAQNPPRGALSQYAGVISIVVAILIITLAFGAPIVSLMPIGVALVALITGHSLLSILELWFSISSVNEVLGTMLALGVGIDYSLLIVSFFAAYGITIAVFQWGWLRDMVGLADTVPIETFFPLMLFAILFGLSMDYEVFLVSRIHEEAVSGRDAGEPVTVGLGATGKIILSAGLIMTSVFLAFAMNPSPVVKQLAFGLAVAVAIDALIIRLIVMPALLHIFGKSTWWLSR